MTSGGCSASAGRCRRSLPKPHAVCRNLPHAALGLPWCAVMGGGGRGPGTDNGDHDAGRSPPGARAGGITRPAAC